MVKKLSKAQRKAEKSRARVAEFNAKNKMCQCRKVTRVVVYS